MSLPSASLTRSRFRQVYAGLAILWVAGSLAIFLTTTRLLHDQIKQSRGAYISSLVRSQAKELEVFRNRPLRDELVQSGVISTDRNFQQLVPAADGEAIQNALESCSFVTNDVCLSSRSALVLVGGTQAAPLKSASVIVLETSTISAMGSLWAWMLAGMTSLGFFTLFIGFGIRSQEKFLAQKIELLMSAIREVHQLISTPGSVTPEAKDEFDSVSLTVEQLGNDLKGKIEQVGRFKVWLKRHTQREQLRETLSHTAHDFRAPLEEGVVFIQNLPTLMKSMPEDELRDSLNSLEQRFQSGIASLDAALKSTSTQVDRKEAVRLGELTADLQNRFDDFFQSSAFNAFVEIDPDLNDIRILASPGALTSVFWNLARNSYEARANGTATLTAETSGTSLYLRFSDNGPGIKHLSSEELFTDFVTSKDRGTGLGLTSAKRVIEDHGGSIRLAHSDFGAVFEIELPIVAASSTKAHEALRHV